MTLSLQLLFTFLNACDGWLTYRVLKQGGREVNPVVKSLMGVVGTYWALVIAKVAAVVAIWYFAQSLGWIFLAFADAIYIGVVYWNYRVWQKQKTKGVKP